MKAMILAAGLGTRLRPLTAGTPKALVTVNGVTLLELAIRKLAGEGFREIIVNVHHHAALVKDFLSRYGLSGVRIEISDESDLLLDTGGGILKARWFLDDGQVFLIYNVDILTNMSLRRMLEAHQESDALATLAVSRRITSRYFLFDKKHDLCGWHDTRTGATRWCGEPDPGARPMAFSGIHVISPGFFNHLTESGKFSIIDSYLRLASSLPIRAFDHTGATWFDLGKPEQIALVTDYIKTHPEFLQL